MMIILNHISFLPLKHPALLIYLFSLLPFMCRLGSHFNRSQCGSHEAQSNLISEFMVCNYG